MKKLKITREEFVNFFPPGLKIAEIGVFKGVYSKTLASSNPSELTLVDIWRHIESDSVYSKLDACNLTDKGHLRIWKRVKESFADNPAVNVVREFSTVYANNVADGYYDVVYIDGDHSYEGCLGDLRAWTSKVKETGFIYGHDYTESFAWIDVIRAVDDFLKENSEWELVAVTAEKPRKSPSWILARKGSIVFDLLEEELIS
jgi:hypothetical protein